MAENKKEKIEEKDETQKESKSSSNWKDIGATIIGIAVFILFVFMIKILLNKVTTENEIEWTRLVYLLSGVEAILFSETGYFFGEKASRVRAEKAEEQIKTNEVEKKIALKEAENSKIAENKIKEQNNAIKVYVRNIKTIDSMATSKELGIRAGRSVESSSEKIDLIDNFINEITK